jgi:hypothetical protein
VSPVKYELGFYIPEDDILHSHCRENLKSYTTKHFSMKTYAGSGFIDPRFLDLDSSCRRVASFTLWLVYPVGREPPDTLYIGVWMGPKAGLDDAEK